EDNLVRTLARGSFVTMFYGVLDPATGRMRFASAGHLPALVWRARDRRVEWRRSKAGPIGALRNGALRATPADELLTLEPGDLLLQLTDGFTEAASERGELFGFDRIEHIVKASVDQGPDAVLSALSQAVAAWSGGAGPQDDETALVVFRAMAVSAES